MKKLLIFCFLIAIASPSIGFSQSALTKEEKVQAMYNLNKKIVESKNFNFIATWVFSDSERGEVTEDTNTITINKSNIYGALTTLDANKPSVMLKGSMQNYNVNFNDETHQITISFRIGAYNATLEVKPSGIAFLELKNSNGTEKLKYRGGLKQNF